MYVAIRENGDYVRKQRFTEMHYRIFIGLMLMFLQVLAFISVPVIQVTPMHEFVKIFISKEGDSYI